MFTLTFTEPGQRPKSHPLLNEELGLLVGREPGCDVVLKSKDVSRRHARFFVREGALHVEDLGSQNGVFVAGARADARLEIKPGAVVEFGDVKVAVAGPAGMGAGAVLRGLGRDSARQIKLPARAVVGRVAECDVVLDDDSVSRKHAELSRDDRGLYRLRDLESANGTFLEGKRLGKEAVLVPDGAKLRFGDVELLVWRPPASAPSRQKLLLAAGAGLLLLFAAVFFFRQGPRRAALADDGSEGDEARALAGQAQAAIESEHFDEAARVAQLAIDKDPLAPGPRKLLAQARREQDSQKAFGDAAGKAQVGRESEALTLLAQVSPQSRFFARARIKAKDLALAIQRTHGQSCKSGRESTQETADECARALDVKCQSGSVDDDPMLRKLRAIEKTVSHRVAWHCPVQLQALFQDDAGGDTGPDEKGFALLYTDPAVRQGVLQYARGDTASAVRTLTRGAAARSRGAREAVERIKLLDGRFREGQTALLSNALERTDQLWGEALQADSALLPAGAESFLGRQMRSTLSRAHGKAGDDRFSRGQYASAYDEWRKGLAVSPHDPHLNDQLTRLEKQAESLIGSGACDQLQIAEHITRADPPSPAHEAAQKGLERCR